MSLARTLFSQLTPLVLTGLTLGALSTANLGCTPPPASPPPPYAEPGRDAAGQPQEPATAEEAAKFVAEVDAELRRIWTASSRAAWVNSNFITDDTDALAAAAEEASMAYLSEVIPKATRFDGLDLPPDIARQLHKLKMATVLPAPNDPAERAELAKIAVEMQSAYGKGKYCPKKDEACLTLGDLTKTMAKSRDYDELLDAWQGWRTISPPLRAKYERFAELGNKGAREIGFADMGALWRSGYDMTPEEFEADIERMWKQVEPLYEQLHCYVRGQLRERYGKERIPERAAIPAHLLGNMWGQEWANIYDITEPHAGQTSIDVSKGIKKKKLTSVQMVKIGEEFFTSLGLDPLPKSFWERSLFDKPKDREVVCHASAWDVSFTDDLRIKMCIEPTEEDLITIHHELGHNYYFHYYFQKPMLFQDGANDGFHEGIGDTLALSVTPAYLKRLGLIDEVPNNPKAELNVLYKTALSKIAFLPFGKMIDQWRWGVFSGKIPPSQYNQAWHALRRQYQGIAPPVARSEKDFDPGAKFHVPGNTPYVRYFLAHIYQFQFHRALCKAAGHKGPLHECSIYGSKEAGRRLKEMLALGGSRPWPDALEALTGERRGDATALLEYFAPLAKYLEEQNKGQQCGWEP